ncbi:MAG: hypothetical protein FJX23_05545 [Alphaproteobacteria bacterium]|nr:hypothetical protein [Alphaproteobacteria bacterium]
MHDSISTKRSILLALVVCVAVTGCAKAGNRVSQAGQSMTNEGKKVDRKIRSWFETENIGEPELANRQPDTAFCYKSIGEVTCYAQPLDGEDYRLKGVQLPPPPKYVDKDSTVPPHFYQHHPDEVVILDAPTSIGVRELPPTGASNQPRELMPQQR